MVGVPIKSVGKLGLRAVPLWRTMTADATGEPAHHADGGFVIVRRWSL